MIFNDFYVKKKQFVPTSYMVHLAFNCSTKAVSVRSSKFWTLTLGSLDSRELSVCLKSSFRRSSGFVKPGEESSPEKGIL